MAPYNEALRQFVAQSDRATIDKIRRMVDQQNSQEQKWFDARKVLQENNASVPELQKFDEQVYSSMMRLASQYKNTLREMGVPLFDGGENPRDRQRFLHFLGDLTS